MDIIDNDPATNILIIAVDAPGHGGAHHVYRVLSSTDEVLLEVSFQNGPVQERGINGVQHEHLLLILRHRLDCFQAGPFKSDVNERTADAIDEALSLDRRRTRRRALAGTEGTSKK